MKSFLRVSACYLSLAAIAGAVVIAVAGAIACKSEPLMSESATAQKTATWLKDLTVTPSDRAVVESMSAYDLFKIIPEKLRLEIDALGMPAFYGPDPTTRDAVYKALQDELNHRAEIMKMSGVFFNRNVTSEAFWDVIEPSPVTQGGNSYHYEITDMILKASRAGGGQSLALIQPYATWDLLNGGYPYDPENPSVVLTTGNLFPVSAPALGPVVDLKAFAAFLANLQAHTDQKFFELGNEVDAGAEDVADGVVTATEYLVLLAASREALKPGTVLVPGGSVGFVHEPSPAADAFWKTFFAGNGGKLIDAFNFHYGNEWFKVQSDPTELEEELDYFNNLMDTHHVPMNNWITEMVVGDRSLTEQQVAEWYLKRFAFAAARRATKIFVESFADMLPGPDGQGEIDEIGQSSMLIRDLSGNWVARQMFYTQKLMNHKLAGFTACTELVYDRQYRFTDRYGKYVYVTWGNTPLPIASHVPVKFTDVFGNETVTAGATPGSDPVFAEETP